MSWLCNGLAGMYSMGAENEECISHLSDLFLMCFWHVSPTSTFLRIPRRIPRREVDHHTIHGWVTPTSEATLVSHNSDLRRQFMDQGINSHSPVCWLVAPKVHGPVHFLRAPHFFTHGTTSVLTALHVKLDLSELSTNLIEHLIMDLENTTLWQE